MSDDNTLSDILEPQDNEPAVGAAVVTGKARYQWMPLRLLAAAIVVGGILGPMSYYVYRTVDIASSGGGAGGADGADGTEGAGGGGFPAGIGARNSSGGRGPLLDQYNLENIILPRDQINLVGPWKDQIPSLTDPKIIPVSQAKMFDKQGRIVVVTINGQTRGLPAEHHQLGEVPLAVIYCPLCDAVSVVDRRMGGQTLEFGVSGLLCYSNVLLYDRTDQALWSQVAMKAVSGPHSGKSLKHLTGWKIMRYGDFSAQYADAAVILTNTRHRRSYRRNPS